jgi:hypothetical protein
VGGPGGLYLQGLPTESGSFTFQLQVEDSLLATALSPNLTLDITPVDFWPSFQAAGNLGFATRFLLHKPSFRAAFKAVNRPGFAARFGPHRPAFRSAVKGGNRLGFASKFVRSSEKKTLFFPSFAASRPLPTIPAPFVLNFIMRGAIPLVSPTSLIYWQVEGAADPTGIHSGHFGNIGDIVIDQVYVTP